MSQALQALSEASHWTPEQMKLITDVVAKNATPDELKLFLYRCNKMGLDPLKPGMVHFIKYNPSSPGTIVVGIEGFRSIAARTGKMSGIKRGVIMEGDKLVAGWCEVYRSDWQHPAREEAPFSEYTTGNGPWAKMPITMIKKVAEAAALRMAFPDDLGGVYERAEMDQGENDNTPLSHPPITMERGSTEKPVTVIKPRVEGSEPPAPQGTGPSEKQLKRMFAIMNSCHIAEETLKQHMFDHFAVTSSKDLTQTQYQAICNDMESGKIGAENRVVST